MNYRTFKNRHDEFYMTSQRNLTSILYHDGIVFIAKFETPYSTDRYKLIMNDKGFSGVWKTFQKLKNQYKSIVKEF